MFPPRLRGSLSGYPLSVLVALVQCSSRNPRPARTDWAWCSDTRAAFPRFQIGQAGWHTMRCHRHLFQSAECIVRATDRMGMGWNQDTVATTKMVNQVGFDSADGCYDPTSLHAWPLSSGARLGCGSYASRRTGR